MRPVIKGVGIDEVYILTHTLGGMFYIPNIVNVFTVTVNILSEHKL